ncbi:hypothetical protein SteCoe_9660 [Stentor coeruleus]|uniref:Golgi apparatus membrane protein TVP23 homolog n=1 Tax=Stentor coeruleus TaxID=5963 RepID=A0A1R2CHL0_9CILI|nr:hypothetical protein SteCoe_9660 [Stentor coeruleus]
MEGQNSDAPPSQGGLQSILMRSGHPIALVFHYSFKIFAIVCYFFLDLFISNSTVTFLIILLFCCADFWTVQNITGRLLVALRWRNKVKDDGSEEWVFESLSEKHENNRLDSLGFWIGLYGYAGVWALLLLANILTLSPFGVTFT